MASIGVAASSELNKTYALDAVDNLQVKHLFNGKGQKHWSKVLKALDHTAEVACKIGSISRNL
jgi:hypothetical protein